ncbi:MAG: hypothetical protein ACXVP5_07840 [Tumebacillaceae bacterium]
MTWIIVVAIIVVAFMGVNIWMYLKAQKRQKAFDAQYNSAKERHEVFVLNKKIVKERPKQGWAKFMKFKTYQVVGRLNLSQTVKGMQMGRMQTVTFHTSKDQFEKIQINHKYKMDLAGNYIGHVLAPPPVKDKDKKKGKADTKTPVKGKAADAKGKAADAKQPVKAGGKKDKAK